MDNVIKMCRRRISLDNAGVEKGRGSGGDKFIRKNIIKNVEKLEVMIKFALAAKDREIVKMKNQLKRGAQRERIFVKLLNNPDDGILDEFESRLVDASVLKDEESENDTISYIYYRHGSSANLNDELQTVEKDHIDDEELEMLQQNVMLNMVDIELGILAEEAEKERTTSIVDQWLETLDLDSFEHYKAETGDIFSFDTIEADTIDGDVESLRKDIEKECGKSFVDHCLETHDKSVEEEDREFDEIISIFYKEKTEILNGPAIIYGGYEAPQFLNETDPLRPQRSKRSSSRYSSENFMSTRSASKKLFSSTSKIKTNIPSMKRKRRRTSCHCSNCRQENCGRCRFCIDMPTFGGLGTLRQRCIERKCTYVA